MKPTSRVFFTELDAWFDTTIATLGVIDSRRAIELVQSKHYTYRLFNEFDGIDPEVFQDRWAKRDREILELAQVTRVPGLFGDFIQRSRVSDHTTPFQNDLELVMNFYPYKLNKEEVRIICQRIIDSFPVPFKIRPVFLDVTQVNPLYIRRHIDVLALYTFNEWLTHHITNEDFVKYPCYEKMLHAPLLFPRKITGMGRKEFLQNVQNTISFLSPMIGVLYHTAEVFTNKLSPRLKEGDVPVDPEDPQAVDEYLKSQGVSAEASFPHSEVPDSLDPPPLDWELLRASQASRPAGGPVPGSGSGLGG